MAKSFEPHAYASALAKTGAFASDGGVLYKWTNTHWEALDERDARVDAYRWLVKHSLPNASDSNAAQALRAAALFLSPVPSLTKQTVIPVCNGYVHVECGGVQLKLADRALGLRHVLNCSYDPGAVANEFAAFVERALPDPSVRLRVQEYIGYTFLPDARFQRAQLWLGEGANGKGLLSAIVRALHHRWASVALDELDGFERSVVLGASLIFADEVPRGKIHEQTIKKMVSGDPIAINRKYQSVVSVEVTGKWIACGNHLPAVTDHSTGFWRRWDIIPFGATVPERERDSELGKRIISNELAGVLNWALEGLLRLLARGRFDPVVPDAMRRAMLDAKVETNSVLAWAEDCDVVVGGPCLEQKSEVFRSYREWCSENALQTLGSVQFWKRVRDLYRDLREERHRVDGHQPRVVNVVVPKLTRPRQLTGMR
ncbi:DNA primase family protein [Hydrogenophaga sp.]|uniref:DNA primase family protein n=1 Tax=Hydrogenophaga sp. TaxID=1904254 RepID=UPI003D2CB1E0